MNKSSAYYTNAHHQQNKPIHSAISPETSSLISQTQTELLSTRSKRIIVLVASLILIFCSCFLFVGVSHSTDKESAKGDKELSVSLLRQRINPADCSGPGLCLEHVNHNGIQTDICVHCESCNAVIYVHMTDTYPSCFKNEQGNACSAIYYDLSYGTIQPVCMDRCPHSVIYVGMHPECMFNSRSQPCQHSYATANGPKCMDECSDQNAVHNTGKDAFCVLNQDGLSCERVFYQKDGTPVCMDECPSQASVVYSNSHPTCMLNSKGDACGMVLYNSKGGAFCGDPEVYTSDVLLAGAESPEQEEQLNEPDAAVAFVRNSSPNTCSGPGECLVHYSHNGYSGTVCVRCENCNSVIFTHMNDPYPTCFRNDEGHACGTIYYDLSRGSITPECFDQCPHSVIYVGMHPECLYNVNSEPCQHVYSTFSGPVCMDDCGNQMAVINTGFHVYCLLNEDGEPCRNIYYDFSTPVCMDDCPSPISIVYSNGKPVCVRNAQGGACLRIMYAVNGDAFCADDVKHASASVPLYAKTSP